MKKSKCEPGDFRVKVGNEIDCARMFWIRVASPATMEAHKQGRLRNLSPLIHDENPDVLVLRGRAMDGLKSFFHSEALPILMSTTRLAYLLMLWAHNKDHTAVDMTLMTVTQWVWIVGGRALAKVVCDGSI